MSNTLPNSFTLRLTNPDVIGADSAYLFDSGAEPITSKIVVTQVNGISYEQILQSQNLLASSKVSHSDQMQDRNMNNIDFELQSF